MRPFKWIGLVMALLIAALTGSNAIAAPDNASITCAAGNSYQVGAGAATLGDNPCPNVNLIVKTDVNTQVVNHGLNGWKAASERIAASATGGTYWVEAAPAAPATASKVTGNNANAAKANALPTTGGPGAMLAGGDDDEDDEDVVSCKTELFIFGPNVRRLVHRLDALDALDDDEDMEFIEELEALVDEGCYLTLVNPWHYPGGPYAHPFKQTVKTVEELLDLLVEVSEEYGLDVEDGDWLNSGSIWAHRELTGSYAASDWDEGDRDAVTPKSTKKSATPATKNTDRKARLDRINKALGDENEEHNAVCEDHLVVFGPEYPLSMEHDCEGLVKVIIFGWHQPGGAYGRKIRAFDTMAAVMKYMQRNGYNSGSMWQVEPEEEEVTLRALEANAARNKAADSDKSKAPDKAPRTPRGEK